jgi:hypothetical protein
LLKGVRGRALVLSFSLPWLGLFVVSFAGGCAPQSADRTPSGQIVVGGQGGADGRGGRGSPAMPPSTGADPVAPPSAAGASGSGGTGGSTATGGPGGSGPEGSPVPVAPPDAAPPDAPPPDTAPPDIGPPLIDALAATCNNLPAWRSGVQYQEGADITHMEPRRRFECRNWPYTPWCSLPVYEPGKTRHWPEAWIDRGRCP